MSFRPIGPAVDQNIRTDTVTRMYVCMWASWNSQVVEFERQFVLSFLLITLHQQTEELCFKDALENAVVLHLVDDKEVVLQSADSETGRETETESRPARQSEILF